MQKNALVLAGGGARGAYQMGVWQALIELDVPINIVTGTSVGALNAALIAQNDFEKAIEIWKKINTSMILSTDFDETLPEKQKVNSMIKMFLRDYAKNGGIDTYPLKGLLDEYCNEEVLRSSEIECGIVAFDKKGLKPFESYIKDLPNGTVNDYLLASSSLYPAIKSCEIDGNEYIDGGYADNLPVKLALSHEADFVIAVDLEAIGIVRRQDLSLAKQLLLIKSYWDLGPLLVFEKSRITRNMRLGYLDTMKSFRAFDGVAYTFIKHDFANFIKTHKPQLIAQNEVFSISFERGNKSAKNGMLHMNIGAFLKRKYGIKKTAYASLLIACAESAGEIFEIDCEKIYSFHSFCDKLQMNLQGQILQSDAPIELVSAHHSAMKALSVSLSLLDKKNRAVYLAVMVKKALLEGKQLDFSALSIIMTEELLAAYFIALLP